MEATSSEREVRWRPPAAPLWLSRRVGMGAAGPAGAGLHQRGLQRPLPCCRQGGTSSNLKLLSVGGRADHEAGAQV